MPMGIDLDDIVFDSPIDKLKNVPRFLKTCKHYIDCYSMRREQYTTLMSIVSCTKNCNLQTNIGYTLINLELTNVYNENNNAIIDIVIYLAYDINETRPCKIHVDSAVEKELDKKTRKHLQKSLCQFKSYDLSTAFENVLNMKPFVWTKETDEDSLLQINSASESDDDGYLASILVQPKKRKSLRIRDSQLKEKRKYSEKSVPIRNKQPKSTTIESNLKRKRLKRATSTSSLNGTKLQDNKDNNRTNNDSNNNTSLDTATSVKEKINKWSGIPFTSTPICSRRKGFPNTAVLSKVNISNITVSESN
ncbi:uncharacterized protein LOC143433244 [Xylocopa sonorina]|uniref:uncharacterized protein LOC143433244 n=1 Tax=Xylocopa sonorina TaxID=1818115 RepID=UPI00403AF19A